MSALKLVNMKQVGILALGVNLRYACVCDEKTYVTLQLPVNVLRICGITFCIHASFSL